MNTVDVLWNVDPLHHQVSVRIRIDTTIQLVRIALPDLSEADPPGAWLAQAGRVLADAIDAVPDRDVRALPEWVGGSIPGDLDHSAPTP